MFAADIFDLHSGVRLLQDRDNLRIGESGLSHLNFLA